MATVPATLVIQLLPSECVLFSNMTKPEVGEIAIHQMYRKCVEEIGDSRQYGDIGVKEKPWLGNHDLLKIIFAVLFSRNTCQFYIYVIISYKT